VGRGPLVEGPLVFFKIGWGEAALALLETLDDVVLGRLWLARWMAVVLEALDPPGPALF
jgi:hypothetical protein